MYARVEQSLLVYCSEFILLICCLIYLCRLNERQFICCNIHMKLFSSFTNRSHDSGKLLLGEGGTGPNLHPVVPLLLLHCRTYLPITLTMRVSSYDVSHRASFDGRLILAFVWEAYVYGIFLILFSRVYIFIRI
jgi:hypothetical protein